VRQRSEHPTSAMSSQSSKLVSDSKMKKQSLAFQFLLCLLIAFGSTLATQGVVVAETDDPISVGPYATSTCPTSHPITVFDEGNKLCYSIAKYSSLAPSKSTNTLWVPEPTNVSFPGNLGNNSLGPCVADVSIDCVKKLEVRRPGESWTQATYVAKALNAGAPPRWGIATFVASSQRNLGEPNCCNLYSLNSSSVGAENFFVQALYDGSSSGPRTYRLVVAAVEKLEMNRAGCLRRDGEKVFMDRTYEPGVLAPFCYGVLSNDIEFRLTLELRQPVTGWIETRITDANWTQTQSGNGLRPIEFSLAGRTTVVPSAYLSVAASNLGELKMYCDSDLPVGRSICNADNKLTWSGTLAQPSGNGMDAFAAYSKALQLFPRVDVANNEFRTWTAIVKQSDSRNLNQCSPGLDVVYGIVGSNAMLMSSELPIWNSANNSIDFVLLSPHYRPNGETAKGFYEMQLNEKVARCLWGTSITPQNVSLSVLDDKGETKVAVATVAVQSGMVIFRASGFSYSVSTLRASLKKPEPATVTSTVKPARRISCIKNGVTKLQPKGVTSCPKGWRKK